jgi:SAM-dependent methyltransferase
MLKGRMTKEERNVDSRGAAPPNPAAIFEIARAYQNSFVLKAAVDLDVCTVIAKGSHSVDQIAKACGASERGIRILCDAMTVLGFLAKNGSGYALTGDSTMFLDSRSPAYMGHAFKFLLHPRQMSNAEDLTEAVRHGGTKADDGFAPDDPMWVDFARGMAPMMAPSAKAMAQILRESLASQSAVKVLDIAAGHGIFGITVAQCLPNAEIYALDWASVLEVARENAQARGVAARHHLIPGSAFEVDFGAGYDAVLLTNFVHHFDPPTNHQLLKKVGKSLKPGGSLLILEFVPNPDRISPATAALFSVTMLSNTQRGDAYTFAELSAMCREAGLEGARLVSLDPLPEALVVARKPL